MKQKLLQLFILFVTMSVLTSSSKDSGTSKGIGSLNEAKASCLNSKNDYATTTISCKEMTAVAEKNTDARAMSMADNEISLSPISRFILVQ